MSLSLRITLFFHLLRRSSYCDSRALPIRNFPRINNIITAKCSEFKKRTKPRFIWFLPRSWVLTYGWRELPKYLREGIHSPWSFSVKQGVEHRIHILMNSSGIWAYKNYISISLMLRTMVSKNTEIDRRVNSYMKYICVPLPVSDPVELISNVYPWLDHFETKPASASRQLKVFSKFLSTNPRNGFVFQLRSMWISEKDSLASEFTPLRSENPFIIWASMKNWIKRLPSFSLSEERVFDKQFLQSLIKPLL